MPPQASAPTPLPPFLARPLSAAYGSVAAWRRRRGAHTARALRAPVISIGGVSAGGSGKTPLAAYVAGLLRDSGERPAILSRGYAREEAVDGVVVVSDGVSLKADLARSGDEPLLLARALRDVAVLVCPDRHLAGCLAESRLGCTVHVLDDGFQHHGVRRDVDLVVVSAADVHQGRVLPEGRLREPVEVLRQADALFAPAADLSEVNAFAAGMGISRVFEVQRSMGVPRLVEPWGQAPRVPRSAPVLAVASIARPADFFASLVALEWNVVDTRPFPDHHRYTRGDVEEIGRAAAAAGASLIVTTEKDLVRLLPWRPLPFQLAWVPLDVDVAPADVFAGWLLGEVARARNARRHPPMLVDVPGTVPAPDALAPSIP